MHQLKRLLDDIYACLNIPVQLLDDNLKTIEQTGITNKLKSHITQNIDLSELTTEDLYNNTFTYNDHYHFAFYHVTTFNAKTHYVLVGPFTSNQQIKHIDLQYKPKHCIPYLHHLIKTVIAQHQKSKTAYPSYISDSIDYIHTHYEEPIQLESLSQHLNINKSYLATLFKQYTNMTFTEFLNRFRTEKSKQYLTQSSASIMDISLQVGFNNHTYYSTTFKKLYGMTPLEYRKQHSA